LREPAKLEPCAFGLNVTASLWGEKLELAADSDLVAFVRDHIRTVWALEILLLLKRDLARCWTAADLERELRANHKLVADILVQFQAGGLAAVDDAGCHLYGPATPQLAALADQIEAAYQQRPVAVINLIAGSGPLRSLADAFKFRGDTGK
jgi:hypothetical protein